MSIFRLYLELGIHHITVLRGYDPILFITALCAVYALVQIMIIAVVLAFSYFFINFLKVKRREWNLILHGTAMGVPLVLIIERPPV